MISQRRKLLLYYYIFMLNSLTYEPQEKIKRTYYEDKIMKLLAKPR